MIKTKVILGSLALGQYEHTGRIPSQEWLSRNSGEVKDRVFNTIHELIAYNLGLTDMMDQDSFQILPEKSIDCKSCESWRRHFSSKEADVFCPDCGNKIMFEIQFDEIWFRNKSYKTREIAIPDEGIKVISSEELSDVLMMDGSPVSKEAEVVDDTVYYYIPERMMKLQDNEIIKYINKNI